MFGPFSLGDSLRVYRLQRRGVSLDLERDLLQPHTPLWDAWLALLTQQAMGQPTYILHDPRDGEAFVQVRFRPHQAAADVTYLAPALNEGQRAVRAWSCLLDGACAALAEHGIQRVFANLPESGAEVEVFHQAGFAAYAGEDVFRLQRVELGPQGTLTPSPRPQRLEDWPAIQKLCVAITPQRVRQAEGGITLMADKGKNCERYVLPGPNEDLVAVLSVWSGTASHWMRLLAYPDAGNAVADLVRWALASLPEHTVGPVYCSVRKYEVGTRSALEAAGFELYASSVLMVRHTAVWVKTPAQELVPALKGGPEPVPPAYHIDSEPELQPSEGRLAARRKA